MDTLAVALLVGGTAFLFSGLLFLLPTERKIASRTESFENSQHQVEYYLSELRKQRDGQSGNQPLAPLR
jgi:hypothetical protein